LTPSCSEASAASASVVTIAPSGAARMNQRMFIGYENAPRLTKALSHGKRTPRVSNLFKRLDAKPDGVACEKQ